MLMPPRDGYCCRHRAIAITLMLLMLISSPPCLFIAAISPLLRY